MKLGGTIVKRAVVANTAPEVTRAHAIRARPMQECNRAIVEILHDEADIGVMAVMLRTGWDAVTSACEFPVCFSDKRTNPRKLTSWHHTKNQV